MPEKNFVLKLNNGADIMQGIEKFANENEIEYGLFASGNGKIKDFELVLSEPKVGISKAKFNGEAELRAVSGKVQKSKGGKVNINLRVSVASTGYAPKTGGLVNGKASGALEIGIKKVDLKKIIEG